ncbi:MAG: prolipoprotein diacylglyceryl transferase [Candidatus Thiosymbion ectosymbiont of Robbea hypermnestra]|nr:prolipoprotein diacylglyceryl transferase [Candidatus Thiosymbion ectosymbiont of Robbea hypermnestra]
MLDYPHIDPVALSLGPLRIHWYGIMYLLAFSAAWALGRYRAARPGSGWTARMVDDGLFYGVLGTILGGRLGYMLFYGFEQTLADPWIILRIWEGGMSFHGGMIGVAIALWLFGRHHGLGLWRTLDFAAPLVPPGLFAGRIGNFINGELWGYPTNLPWGMRLPCEKFGAYCEGLAPGARWSPPLHASQLYEAALEGLALFLILWLFSARPRPTMAVTGLFLLGYGTFRFGVEFVRLPDAHLGYLAFDRLTMGQLLTLPMILLGTLLLVLAYRRARP